MPKRILSGTVVSSNSNKTIVVKVTRRVMHKLYKKIISRSKNYHAHDEDTAHRQAPHAIRRAGARHSLARAGSA